jgi:dienelactone hydrolase
MKHSRLAIFVILALMLTACQIGGGGTPATAPAGAASEAPATATETIVAEALATEPPSEMVSIPPVPQEVAFRAADGQALAGLYYPAASSPAPLVVLMHWVRGDMSEWYEIAVWLQNRGLDNPFPNPEDAPWWDPTWFPPLGEGVSYGVFIFSFRGCTPSPAGCSAWTPDAWLLDAQAAAATAVTLDGVDPTRIVFIGSSIGADGAVDGCAWLAENQPGACQGTLSLSPGDYLNLPYSRAVQTLGAVQPPIPAWCLADEAEIGLCNRAAGAGNPAFRAIEIPGGGHGNMLLRPGLDPLPMQLILDFLSETIGQ